MSTNLHIDDIGNLILRDGKLGLSVSSQNTTPPHYGGGRVGALSPYAYCAGDPVNFIDPDGCRYIVSETENQIIIKQTYYTKDDISHKAALKGAKFWNGKSGKYTANGKIVVFQIDVVKTDELSWNSSVQNDDEKGNGFSVVASLPPNKNGEARNGATSNDNVRVVESRADTETVEHEMGHSLGLTHTFSGLMTPSSTERNGDMSVPKRLIRKIINRAVRGKPAKESNGNPAGAGKVDPDNPAKRIPWLTEGKIKKTE